MNRGTRTAMAPCPDCGRTVTVGAQPKQSLKATCASCGIDLEIVCLEPLEFDWGTDEREQDWWPDEALGC